ncbi:hypothetical protein [Nocardia iowensis]|uniref:DUF6841 domain-containing protein n=1 Tax=Nocardia iowensis TaxID=204891 RepID=A0ABX8RIL2_NOCIO|nr:hypothetical protein [Nocardia iowensis]QXN88812.1 hypothetical protein KV110_24880 [Nocardia iowensis]
MSSDISAEVQAFFDRYVAAWHDHTSPAQQREDTAWVLEFYGVPISLMTPAGYIAFTDQRSLLEAYGQELQRLSDDDYADSIESGRSVRVLNDLAAVIETTFTRNDRQGQVIESYQATFLAARTDLGWRFVSIVNTPTEAG